MKLTWHITGKDLRRMALPAGLWLAFLSLTTAGFRVLPLAVRGDDARLGEQWLAMISGWTQVIVALESVIGFVLAGAMMLEDPVPGSRAWWRTRPVANARLLAGKLLAAGLLFVVAPAAVLAVTWLACGFSAAEIARAAGPVLAAQAALTIAALALASLTESLRGFLLASLALYVGFTAITTVDFSMGGEFAPPANLLRSRALLVHYAVAPCLFVVLAHQVLTRRTARSWALVASWIVLTALVRNAWPWDLTPRIFAAWPPARTAADERVRVTLASSGLAAGESAALHAMVEGVAGGRLVAPVGGYAELTWSNGATAAAQLERDPFSWSAAAARALVSEPASVGGAPWNIDLIQTGNTRVPWTNGPIRLRGRLLLAELRARIVGEARCEEGAELAEGATRSRIASLVRREDGTVQFVIEERSPADRRDRTWRDPRGTIVNDRDTFATYLYVNRARNLVRPLPLGREGTATLNGLRLTLRQGGLPWPRSESDRGSVADPVDGGVLVKVRFDVDHHFAQPLAIERLPIAREKTSP